MPEHETSGRGGAPGVAPGVERWGLFEVALTGPAEGNPYLDVTLDAVFALAGREVRVPGFYDGDGTYRVRFMPDHEGVWTYRTRSSAPALDGAAGSVEATATSPGNHGPVHARGFHFAHADGTPYVPFGTTCYAWTHQPVPMQDETLATLKGTRFNKMRMGVFPKDYPYNANEPLHRIYTVGPDGTEDFDRPNPAAFRHFEAQVAALQRLGIEADIIVFHPYDRWGYSGMSAGQDQRYVAYLAARLSAYRNVWWSLANEYDFLLDTKPMALWDRFFHILEENDPYRHLTSIHNGEPTANYDHRKPWVSHVCIQNWDVKRTREWRDAYAKPVVNDEPEYEGDLIQSWGNISGRELVHRFWVTVTNGGYAGHGETFRHPEDLIWWAKGGILRGEAWRRIGFLRDLLEEDVRDGLEPISPDGAFPWNRVSGARDGEVRLIYFGEHQPGIWAAGLPDEPDGHQDDWEVDLIDTWAMTVEPATLVPAPGNFPTRHGAVRRPRRPDAAFAVQLPGRPYLAVRVRPKRERHAGR